MFDSSYKFNYIGSESTPSEPFNKKHRLSFRSHTRDRYIVEVEEYDHDLYAIKYYLKAHELSPNKFKLLTGLNQPAPVIRTCINIMLYFIERRNPWASFIFIGAQLKVEDSQKNTKRFRVYKSVMENFFKPIDFDHYYKEENSIYIILNKLKIENDANILQHIEKIALKYYEIEGKNHEETPP